MAEPGASDEIPAGFVDRLQTILPSECLERYLGDVQNEAPTAFRTNTLKTTPAELWRQLRNDGLHPTPLEWRKRRFPGSSRGASPVDRVIGTGGGSTLRPKRFQHDFPCPLRSAEDRLGIRSMRRTRR